METSPDHIKEEIDLDQMSDPAEPFVIEKISDEQESEPPAQDFIKHERVVPSTQGFIQEESAENKFLTQVTMKEKAAVMKGEINQYQVSNNTPEDDSSRYLLTIVLKQLSLGFNLLEFSQRLILTHFSVLSILFFLVFILFQHYGFYSTL
jgi:hypothetical protein